MAEKTAEELEAERLATEAAATETARLAAEAEATRLAAEVKTPEQLEAERVAAEATEAARLEAEKNGKQPEDWRDRRIAQLTARLKNQEPVPKEQVVPDPALADMVPKAEVDRLANERAQALADRAAFNAACNSAAQEGRKIFPDFDASVAELAKVVDRSDAASRQAYDSFLEAALETGEAPKIIYALGRDLNEAMRIMELSPIKRAAELAALAGADLGQVSNLPKPIVTVQGKNAGPSEIVPDDPARADKLSSAEWHRRREAQVASQAKSYDRRARG